MLKVPALQRGWMSSGRLTFTSEYPLGLWYSWGYAHVPCYTLVFPRAETDAPPLPEGNSKDTTDNMGETSGCEIASSSGNPSAIREYRPGDNIVAIDWKASARGQGLHTREFSEQGEPDKVRLTWDQTSELTDVESRLSRLAAWVHHCSKSGREWNLELPGHANNQDNALSSDGNAAGMSRPDRQNDQLWQSLEMLAMFGLTAPANQKDADKKEGGQSA